MALLDDGPSTGAKGATGAAGAAAATGRATDVAGTGAGSMGAIGATDTANAAAAMGVAVDAGTNLLEDATGTSGTASAAGTRTATVVANIGAGSTGAPRATVTSLATASMFGTTNSGTTLTTGKYAKRTRQTRLRQAST